MQNQSQKLLSFSFFKDYDDLYSALMEGLLLKRSSIKKIGLKRSLLKKKVRAREVFDLPIDLLNKNKINYCYTGSAIEILFDDGDLLVLNKPAGVHSVPLLYSDTNNCLSFLRSHQKFAHFLHTNCQNSNRGLLNRLDFETSGVLIYIKNESFYHLLRKNFDDYIHSKIYLAVVRGYFNYSGIVENNLIPMGVKGGIMGISEQEQMGLSVRAQLEVHKLTYNKKKDLSLLKIKLVTGHRHQIRVQLSHMGFSILGDPLYGNDFGQRLFLHAYNYQLQLPSSKEYSFFAPPPALFDDFFDLNGIL